MTMLTLDEYKIWKKPAPSLYMYHSGKRAFISRFDTYDTAGSGMYGIYIVGKQGIAKLDDSPLFRRYPIILEHRSCVYSLWDNRVINVVTGAEVDYHFNQVYRDQIYVETRDGRLYISGSVDSIVNRELDWHSIHTDSTIISEGNNGELYGFCSSYTLRRDPREPKYDIIGEGLYLHVRSAHNMDDVIYVCGTSNGESSVVVYDERANAVFGPLYCTSAKVIGMRMVAFFPHLKYHDMIYINEC